MNTVHLVRVRRIFNVEHAPRHVVRHNMRVWEGVPMECVVDYQEGESTILWPTDMAHPGSPPECVLESCKVGGVEIIDMLTASQLERLENAAAEQLEFA